MPSPLGHALAGIAAGWCVAPGTRPGGRPAVATITLYATAGMLPDLDLAFGSHSGPTHGLGAAVIAGAATMLFARRMRGPMRSQWFRAGLAIALAYASHTLLDWLGTDTSPPIGIMALWPVSREYYESSLHVFMAISRRYWLPEFWTYNLRALAHELLILLPPAAVILWARRPARLRVAASVDP